MLSRRRPQSTSVLYWACTFVPTCAIVLSCVGFLVTRLQVFSEALNGEFQRRAQETWLRRECQKPDFYANLQLHADLCDKVEANARGSPFLAAFAHLFEHTYLCGYSPCAEILDHTFDWVAGHGLPFLVLFGVVALLLPTVLVPLYRQYLVHAADAHVAQRYHHPFGHTQYPSDTPLYLYMPDRAYPQLKHD